MTIQVKYKAGQTDRASSVTVTDDPDLQAPLLSGLKYVIEVTLSFFSTSSSPGVRAAFSFTGTATTCHGMVVELSGGAAANNATSHQTFLLGASNITAASQWTRTTSAAAAARYKVHAWFVIVPTNNGVFSLRWAQSVSNATATSLAAGSHMVLDSEVVGAGPPVDPTVLMLHMNGADGSTTFVDSSSYAHAVMAFGNAQVDTAQSKYGGASLLLDGSGDYLQISDSGAFDFGSDDFTMEAWIRGNSWGSSGQFKDICSQRLTSIDHHAFSWMIGSVGTVMYFNYTTNGTTQISKTASFTFALNTWYHVCVMRSGASFYMFVDGVLKATHSMGTDVMHDSSAPFKVGMHDQPPFAASAFNGWIDDLRISRAAIYNPAGFTPPAAELTP